MEKLKCVDCSFEGFEVAFGKRWALPRDQDVCLRCLHSKHRKQLKRSPWATLAMLTLPLMLGIALIESDSTRAIAYVVLGLGIAQVLFYPLIALHEVGHAVAARAAGFEVVQVAIGIGRRLWAGSVAGVRVVVNAVPVGGYTMAGTLDRRNLRRRFFALVAGGPLVNAGLMLIGLALISVTPLHGSSAYWLAFLWVLAALNGFMLIGNLIPHRLIGPYELGSDGMQMLQAISADQARQDIWMEGYFVARWMVCRDLRDIEGALRWCAQGLERHPRSWSIGSCRAFTLLETGDALGARAILLGLREHPDLKPIHRLVLNNNLAWADFLANDATLLGEADALSKEALEAMPWQVTFQSTRGSVLVALGRQAEGLSLLKKAFDEEIDSRNRATIASVLAMANASTGEVAAGQEWLDRARALDGRCALLPRAEAAVGAVT
jgi:Zn-dependent protease